jgi:dephospho-CoA kinase
MYIIGLTGGIGSGKTTVGNCFSQLGINVINADIAARKVVEKGSPALTQVVEFFGQQSLLENGTLNRAFLREEIFNDTNKRQWVEALLHPLIQIWIKQALENSSSAYTILESPLLLETDQHRLVDRILVVDIPKELQVQRSGQRDGNDKQQIQAIMNTQLSREERLKQADDIIDNSEPLEGLPSKVETLHQNYLKLASKKSHE